MALAIGVDVGGTFTDVVAWEPQSGRLWLEKVPTTPDDPSRGTVAGIQAAVRKAGFRSSDVEAVRHGTTVATNALIQRSGARTGLLTTRGFRDVLEIGRTKRDVTYDLLWDRPPPLVRRRHRREVDERVSASGEPLRPIDLSDVEREFRFLVGEGIESIAVSFLNSYANPVHEERAVERLRALHHGVAITRGSEILPDLSEYERTNLAVVNAYVTPLISRYLSNLQSDLRKAGMDAQITVMQSNGGAMEIPYARTAPVRLLLSGPCAGVTGATHIARNAGIENLVTFDMGGTSCDVCLVEGGVAQLTTNGSVAGFTLALLPMLYINTIGAGGGSIAWVDSGGALKVGPTSAGAVPGPACYGQGGTKPTVTDAWVSAGYLDPTRFVGGALRLDAALAERSLRAIAEPLGLGLAETSQGVLMIVEANMVNAVKAVSVKRGRDPKELTLVAYGGAGPCAAAGVARQLGMRRVLVPRHPGLVCALGTLLADVQYDILQSFRAPLDREVLPRLRSTLDELARTVAAHFGRTPAGNLGFRREAYLRYSGQFHSLPVPLPEVLDEPALDRLRDEFDGMFLREFGHARKDQVVEFDRLRVVASDRASGAPGFAPPHPSQGGEPRRRTLWTEGRATPCDIWDWSGLAVGTRISGPAVVEEFDSTVWIPPDARAEIIADGSILMEL